jgi:hypothetical protein
MALETTTTSLNDFTNASLVEPTVILALTEQSGFVTRNFREFSIIGKPTNAIAIPTQTSWWGTPNDAGAGVDTEFGATEGTSLGNTQAASGVVTITAAEYGVAHALTDNVGEDSVLDGLEMLNFVTGPMILALGLALDDDGIALLASLSNSVGTTNTDLTVAVTIAAQQGLRVRGANADAIAYLFDNKQALDIETALIGANAAAAVYALSADRLIGYAPSADHGMGSSRQVMTFRGAPVITSGLTDTANATVDVVGACFCPSTAYNDASGATTFGYAWKRLPRFEMQRQAKGRSTDLVMTMRAGVAELQDGSGTKIISNAVA